MTRKYYNDKLQTKPWHPEEEPHKNNENQEENLMSWLNILVVTGYQYAAGFVFVLSN